MTPSPSSGTQLIDACWPRSKERGQRLVKRQFQHFIKTGKGGSENGHPHFRPCRASADCVIPAATTQAKALPLLDKAQL